MPTSQGRGFRPAGVAMKGLTAMAAVAALVLAAGSAGRTELTSARTASTPVAHRAGPVIWQPETAGGNGGGNLEVVVPDVPSLPALRQLCRAFEAQRAGHDGPSGVEVVTLSNGPPVEVTVGSQYRHGGTGLELLEGVTGGTPAATAVWCGQFMARQTPA